MHKAWHVWTKKNEVLSETHFCKKCGRKIGVGKEIKGIIYDLDGTIISSEKLHKLAWLFAGKKFDIYISSKMLLNQTGISNEAAAKMMLSDEKKYLTKQFVETKAKYVMENVNQIILFPTILATIKDLLREECKIWVCTSAHKNFVKKVFNTLKPLKKIIKDNVVWREMYKKEKPFPDPLNLTIKKMGLAKSQVSYIGNASSDYKTAIAAKIKFIYFCPKSQKKDSRIPKSTPVISSHKEVLKLLK
jgi:beta-phosphoglucomutase